RIEAIPSLSTARATIIVGVLLLTALLHTQCYNRRPNGSELTFHRPLCLGFERDTLISKAAMRKSFQTAGRSPLGYLFGIAVPHWFASVRLLSPANRRIGLWPQCPLWVKSRHSSAFV